MAASIHIISTGILALLLLAATSVMPTVANFTADNNSTKFIRTSCGATLYPALCFASLARYASVIQQDPVQLACVAANVSLSRVRAVRAHVEELWHMSAASGTGIAAALRDCAEELGDATDQMRSSAAELERLEKAKGSEIAWRVSNAQTWISAALTNEDTCTDGIVKGAGGSDPGADVCHKVRRAKEYTSNALALTNRLVASR